MGIFNNETSYGLSLLLSGLAVIVFVLFAFMGLDYLFEGSLIVPVLLTVSCGMLLVLCLRAMCSSKQTRNRNSGLMYEVGASLVVLVIIVLGSVPFMKFLTVIGDRDEIRARVNEMVKLNGEVIPRYHEYADARLADYRVRLQSVGADGLPAFGVLRADADHALARDSMYRSLERRLLPAGIGDTEAERKEWLDNIRDISVWNVFTPKNVRTIAEAGEYWAYEYSRLSDRIYMSEGDDASGFEVEEMEDSMSWYRECFVGFTSPNLMVVGLTLLCYVFMLTPYFTTRRSRATFSGTHGGWN